jgi:hypothetical protein|tara:strand:+ start:7940 stop:8236 length:297 start_codon:yes stop_codon:yes gene_type:complete
MKSLFIRCSQETYDLAHALAKKESRSLNKQIIHMIHSMADEKNVQIKQLLEESKEAVEELDIPEQIGKEIYSGAVTSDSVPVSGLSRLAETKKQDYQD